MTTITKFPVTKLTQVLDSKVRHILSLLDKEFDSHEFINKLIEQYKADYESLCSDFKTVTALHGHIGLYLRELEVIGVLQEGNPKTLKTTNIHDKETENHNWIKI